MISKLVEGETVPIPIWPCAFTRNLSVLLVLITRSSKSLVPRPVMVELVPLLPVSSQALSFNAR